MTGTDKTIAKKKKLKSTNNDLQNTTQTTKDSATRTPQLAPAQLMASVVLRLSDKNIIIKLAIQNNIHRQKIRLEGKSITQMDSTIKETKNT
jgi:hypothetical protein